MPKTLAQVAEAIRMVYERIRAIKYKLVSESAARVEVGYGKTFKNRL